MGSVRVTVNEAGIQSLFEPGGAVGREGRSLGSETVNVARITGPKRTGRLVGSLRSLGSMRRFAYGVTIFTKVPYAPFVMGGTGPRIYPKNGLWLKVPKHRSMALGGSGGYTFKMSVRGQRANPFLIRSAETVMRGHGYSVSLL